MAKQAMSLNNLRIASPCPIDWDQMVGGQRVRFCHLCSLNVYNISEMTTHEAHSLIRGSEGRICARLYRRADGTVLTKDCPVGLRALRRRMARVAGAAFAAVLGLWSVGFSQSTSKKDASCMRVAQLKLKRTGPRAGKEVLRGTVKDVNGAIIANAEVLVTNERTKAKHLLATTDEGEFRFSPLADGLYTLTFKYPGFKTFTLEHLELTASEPAVADITLEPAGDSAIVGILVDSPDFESSNGVTTFRGEIIRRLPLP